MRSLLIISTLLGLTLGNGQYHQEYNFRSSSQSYRNNELQHSKNQEEYFSKHGDLDGLTKPKIDAHSEQSEYVNPKYKTLQPLQTIQPDPILYGEMNTGQHSSYGQINAQHQHYENRYANRQSYGASASNAYGNYGGGNAAGMGGFGYGNFGGNYDNYAARTNLRTITQQVQEQMARQLQEAIINQHRRSMAISGRITQEQIQNDMRALQEELRRNMTYNLEQALMTQYGTQGIRGGMSYSLANGRLQPVPNYNQIELEDLKRQMELDLMRQLEEGIRSSYHTTHVTTVHTHRTHQTHHTGGNVGNIGIGAIHQPYYPRPVPNIPSPIIEKPDYGPVIANPDSITTIATRVQHDLNEHLNKILDDTEKRYFSIGSRQAQNWEAILIDLQNELRSNISHMFDLQLRNNYGGRTDYRIEDLETYKRQIENNLSQKLNRDFLLQKDKYFRTYAMTSGAIAPGNGGGLNTYYFEPRPFINTNPDYANNYVGTVNQAEINEMQNRLRDDLSRQVQAAIMQQKYRHMYGEGASQYSQTNYQHALQQLTEELNRNLTRQLQHSLSQYYGNNYGNYDTQMARLRQQLEGDLQRQLQQGLQQTYSYQASWSSSSSRSSNSNSNYRQSRGSDSNGYQNLDDCMMGDDPNAMQGDDPNAMQGDDPSAYGHHDQGQQTLDQTIDDEDYEDIIDNKKNSQQDYQDLTQQIEDEDLTQQIEDQHLTPQDFHQKPDKQKLKQFEDQDLTQQIEDQHLSPHTYREKPKKPKWGKDQDFTQKIQYQEDLTQQIEDEDSTPNNFHQKPNKPKLGKLEAQDSTQQIEDEDLTQQIEDQHLTPQDFQQKPDKQKLNQFEDQDLTQQIEDQHLSPHTYRERPKRPKWGKLQDQDFTQQIQYQEDLTQQIEDEDSTPNNFHQKPNKPKLGKLEAQDSTQQIEDEDLTQQIEDQHLTPQDFQQKPDKQKLNQFEDQDLTQQIEDQHLSPHTYRERPKRPKWGKLQDQDFTQQIQYQEDLTQQIEDEDSTPHNFHQKPNKPKLGKLEAQDLTQQIEDQDLTQQIDDEDLTQQIEDHDIAHEDLTQQIDHTQNPKLGHQVVETTTIPAPGQIEDQELTQQIENDQNLNKYIGNQKLQKNIDDYEDLTQKQVYPDFGQTIDTSDEDVQPKPSTGSFHPRPAYKPLSERIHHQQHQKPIDVTGPHVQNPMTGIYTPQTVTNNQQEIQEIPYYQDYLTNRPVQPLTGQSHLVQDSQTSQKPSPDRVYTQQPNGNTASYVFNPLTGFYTPQIEATHQHEETQQTINSHNYFSNSQQKPVTVQSQYLENTQTSSKPIPPQESQQLIDIEDISTHQQRPLTRTESTTKPKVHFYLKDPSGIDHEVTQDQFLSYSRNLKHESRTVQSYKITDDFGHTANIPPDEQILESYLQKWKQEKLPQGIQPNDLSANRPLYFIIDQFGIKREVDESIYKTELKSSTAPHLMRTIYSYAAYNGVTGEKREINIIDYSTNVPNRQTTLLHQTQRNNIFGNTPQHNVGQQQEDFSRITDSQGQQIDESDVGIISHNAQHPYFKYNRPTTQQNIDNSYRRPLTGTYSPYEENQGSYNRNRQQVTQSNQMFNYQQHSHSYRQQNQNIGYGPNQPQQLDTAGLTQQVQDIPISSTFVQQTEDSPFTQQTEDIEVIPPPRQTYNLGYAKPPASPYARNQVTSQTSPIIPQQSPYAQNPQTLTSVPQQPSYSEYYPEDYQLSQFARRNPETSDLTQQIQHPDYDWAKPRPFQQPIEPSSVSPQPTRPIQQEITPQSSATTPEQQNLAQASQTSDLLLEALRSQIIKQQITNTDQTQESSTNYGSPYNTRNNAYKPSVTYASPQPNTYQNINSGSYNSYKPSTTEKIETPLEPNRPLVGQAAIPDSNEQTTNEPIEEENGNQINKKGKFNDDIKQEQEQEQEQEEDIEPTTTQQPGFWKRLGNSIKSKTQSIRESIG